MHVLYVIHAFPWNEMTGATLVLDNYVKQALLSGVSVSIMVPDVAYKHIENCEYGDDVRLYSFSSQDNWGVSGFDYSLLNQKIIAPALEVIPDIVHIIDWVNCHPAIFPYLKKIGCPVVHTVCNFEEFCPFAYPVFYGYNSETCAVPLNTDQCLDCVSDNHELFVPGALYTYKVLMRDLAAYRNNYRQGMVPLLSRRTDFVKSLFKNYVDYVVFPSANFGQYFLAQLQESLNYKVIPHGLSEVVPMSMRESTWPIKIIYTGGGRVNKGWSIMAKVIEILARTPNPGFEIHCVGNTQGIPESYFQNPNIKLIRCLGYRREDEAEFLSRFDIAVAPSKFESYGLFVRECVRARAVPLVIPTLGVSDFIVNGENGFQVGEPYAENLAKAILELTADASVLTALRARLNVTSVPTAEAEFGELHDLYCELTSSQ